MKFIRDFLDKQKPLFEKGGKFEKFYYIWEANETFLFAPNHTTGARGAHIRDAVDLKRMMMTVIIAMVPCLLFGIWNVGDQHYQATGGLDATLWDKIWIGSKLVLPIVIVSYAVGLGLEFALTIVTRHPVNEGYLVTGMLIPLVMPPTIPLWQVALATIFAVVIGKEAFGGTGMNILNVALTARAFLYFAYPSQISGDVWTYLGGKPTVDGYSGATPLALSAEASSGASESITAIGEATARYEKFPTPDNQAVVDASKELAETLNTGTAVVDSFQSVSWSSGIYEFSNMFFGFMPGSIGETSTLMALIGGIILIMTGVGSWKIIVSVFAGAYIAGTLLNFVGANEYMLMPAHYHLVIGGLAFGAVFMATDPVTAAQTERGKWIYGFLIGVLTVIIRVLNPAYPEGIMLAILLMNVFAPLIDFYIVKANKKRRLKRATV